MWRWLQRPSGKHQAREDPVEAVALAKRRAELADLQLGVRERQLKIDAIQRVVESESDAVTALEVVAVATHRGKLPPTIYQRRKAETSPLETLAMRMLEQRLTEDPTDALERMIERRERLETAADRFSGAHRDRDEYDSGNTFVDVARALANSPLGEAIGNVLGAGAQQRMAVAAAASGQPVEPPPVDGAGVAQDAAVEALAPGAGLSPPAPASALPRPVSFRVGMALRALKAMAPQAGARWIMAQADAHEQLAELVGPFVAAEPQDVPTILSAYLAEASAPGADPSVAEWVPLVQHLIDVMPWTLEAHRAMGELLAETDQEQADELDQDLAARGG